MLDTEAHTRLHAHRLANTHRFTNAYTHSLTNVSTERLNWQTYTCSYWQAFIIHPPATHKHSRTHTNTHLHTYTNTHTHAHRLQWDHFRAFVQFSLFSVCSAPSHTTSAWNMIKRIKAALHQLTAASEMTSLSSSSLKVNSDTAQSETHQTPTLHFALLYCAI